MADDLKESYCKNNQAFVCMIKDLNVIENTPKRPPTVMKYVAKKSAKESSGGEEIEGSILENEEAVVNPEVVESAIVEMEEAEEQTPADKE